jgi:2-polyprenyl-6-methoxyphenol hydroxylase-like FAD-dependent oxidoreductase
MSQEPLPVLIVGAGPVGLSTALALAQSGVAIRLIDRLKEPTNQSRAAIIHARTLEMLERLGIVEDFLNAGTKVHGAEIYGPNNVLLTHPNMDHLPSAYAYMVGLEQNLTEHILRERLAALGVQVEREITLTGFEQADDKVTVRYTRPDGAATAEEFCYVIGADGATSTVRHTLGLVLEGETIDATWITADVKIDWSRSLDTAAAYLTTEGFAFFAPMNDGRWRVLVNMKKMSREESAGIALADLQKILLERFHLDAPMSDCVWMSPFSINTRMTSTMRDRRVFLVGDAAHVHSPVGGQGMNTGIQDGLNLAWKLALVVQGIATESLLETFNFERHRNAQKLLQLVGPATKLINLRHPVPVEIRNFAIRTLSQLGLTAQMPRNFSMLGVEYLKTPLNAEHHTRETLKDTLLGWLPFDHAPKPGQRAPDVAELSRGGDKVQRLFEFWKGDPRHQLLVFAGTNLSHEQLETLLDFAKEFTSDFIKTSVITASPMPNVSEALTDINGEAHATYGAAHEALYLIRPDGYIAFRSDKVDRNSLKSYLDEWYPHRAG